jgi:hypothetical protein
MNLTIFLCSKGNVYFGSGSDQDKKSGFERIQIHDTNICTLKAVLRIRIRIRIHRIPMFLGIPDPDPLVRGMDLDPDSALDPDPDPSIIMQKY